jgi:hypothetical protein
MIWLFKGFQSCRTVRGIAGVPPSETSADPAMDDAPKLRYVDPYKRRGRLYLAVCRLSTAKAGLWLSAHVAWKLDPYLLKLTRGRFSTTGPVAAALLETRGARTVCRSTPKSWRTKPSGNDCGSLLTASSRNLLTTVSGPGRQGGSSRSFSWFHASSTDPDGLAARTPRQPSPSCCRSARRLR